MIVTATASIYPRESIEYIRFGPVTVDDQPITSGYQYAVTADGDRPPAATDTSGWADPDAVGDHQAFLLDGARPPGLYQVWVLVDDQDEHVIIQAGSFRLE